MTKNHKLANEKVYTNYQHVIKLTLFLFRVEAYMFDTQIDVLKEQFAEYRRMITNADDMPAYKVLQYMVQKAIEQGDWQPGQMIPPERIFAQCTGMGVGTVKKAMLNLVTEGVLFRRQGSGTYVAMPSFTRQMRRYYLFIDDFSGQECENVIHLHSIRRVKGIPEINRLLQLAEDEELLEVIRVFKEKENVVVLSKTWLNANFFAGLEQVVKQRFEHVPLFVIIEEDYGLLATHSEELIGIDYLSEADAGIFGQSPGEAALKIRTLNYANKSAPYEYRESLCLTGGKYMYRNVSY